MIYALGFPRAAESTSPPLFVAFAVEQLRQEKQPSETDLHRQIEEADREYARLWAACLESGAIFEDSVLIAGQMRRVPSLSPGHSQGVACMRKLAEIETRKRDLQKRRVEMLTR